MHVGIDFGTSNNAVSVYEAGAARLLPVGDEGATLLPSALHIDERALIPLRVLDYLDPSVSAHYQERRHSDLLRARQVQQLEGLDGELRFGEEAFAAYMHFPGEGYFIKSPKSFLGVSGLGAGQLNLFEDICTVFLGELRRRAEQALGARIDSVTMGRPVHFLGFESGDEQALGILRRAAANLGWHQVDFCFEPVAAGYHFARKLEAPATVLVADIGGGTSDFSLLKLAPDGQCETLGHTGRRVGGNDFDIALANASFMPHFGLGETTRKGLPLPTALFHLAMAVNDIPKQRTFYDRVTRREIDDLLRDCAPDARFQRFSSIWEQQRSFEIVRLAEQCKVSLGEQAQAQASVPGLDEIVEVSHQDFSRASERVVAAIESLVPEAQPDMLYVTGGAAQSAVMQAAFDRWLPDVPRHFGNYLDGVASGLCRPGVPRHER